MSPSINSIYSSYKKYKSKKNLDHAIKSAIGSDMFSQKYVSEMDKSIADSLYPILTNYSLSNNISYHQIQLNDLPTDSYFYNNTNHELKKQKFKANQVYFKDQFITYTSVSAFNSNIYSNLDILTIEKFKALDHFFNLSILPLPVSKNTKKYFSKKYIDFIEDYYKLYMNSNIGNESQESSSFANTLTTSDSETFISCSSSITYSPDTTYTKDASNHVKFSNIQTVKIFRSENIPQTESYNNLLISRPILKNTTNKNYTSEHNLSLLCDNVDIETFLDLTLASFNRKISNHRRNKFSKQISI